MVIYTIKQRNMVVVEPILPLKKQNTKLKDGKQTRAVSRYESGHSTTKRPRFSQSCVSFVTNTFSTPSNAQCLTYTNKKYVRLL